MYVFSICFIAKETVHNFFLHFCSCIQSFCCTVCMCVCMWLMFVFCLFCLFNLFCFFDTKNIHCHYTAMQTFNRRASSRSILVTDADGKPRPWRSLQVTVNEATGMNMQTRRTSIGGPAETASSFRCTLVPLVSRAQQIEHAHTPTQRAYEIRGAASMSMSPPRCQCL